MRPLRDYIVHVPVKYKDVFDTASSVVIFKDPTIPDVWDAYREGTVRFTPIGDDSGVLPGDRLIFHHNIVNEGIMQGQRVKSDFVLDEEERLYMVPKTEAYGYYRDGVFTAIDGFVFVKPLSEEIIHSDVIEIPSYIKDKELTQIGILRYGCKQSKEIGVQEGDKVKFSRFSEYPYEIEGEKVYRMRVKDLEAKIE